MTLNLSSTIDLWEVLWVLMAVVGLSYHIRGNFRATELIRRARRDGVNGPVLNTLLGWRINERARAAKQFLFGSAGVMLMFLPASPPGMGFRFFVGLYLRFAFITAEVIMVVLSRQAYVRYGEKGSK